MESFVERQLSKNLIDKTDGGKETCVSMIVASRLGIPVENIQTVKISDIDYEVTIQYPGEIRRVIVEVEIGI